MNRFFSFLGTLLLPITCYLLPITASAQIDRHALVERNNPVNTMVDTLGTLTVGNGDFAFSVDATGLQTFPAYYNKGVCLGTQSTWGWHSFPNKENFTPEDALKPYDFGRHIKNELYSVPTKIKSPEDKRAHDAAEYLRANPHRLNLGVIGFAFGDSEMRMEGIYDYSPYDIQNINQKLDMWTGVIDSRFTYKGVPYHVETQSATNESSVVINVSDKAHTPIMLRLPYATGKHVDDACDWYAERSKHTSAILAPKSDDKNSAVITHQLDSTLYYIYIHWEGKANLTKNREHRFYLTPEEDSISVRFTFSPTLEGINRGKANSEYIAENKDAWQYYWTSGAAVDFSHCKAPEAKELERRVVLSQYLLKVNCSGQTPPQETGLTFNSWFGKFHLEMPIWHQAWMPLWGHPELLVPSMDWYSSVVPIAKSIAKRQGFKGIRWMKMTDPSGMEAPSSVGSFLIWQQPHYIYLSELIRRHYFDHYEGNTRWEVLDWYNELIDSTAEFMADFASYDAQNKRYILKHYIPAQESLSASVTYNSPYELSEWFCTLKMAQNWRKMCNKPFRQDWQNIIDSISPLASKDGLYLAAESATDTYSNIKMTSDHPAILGAIAFYPMSRLVDEKIMNNTLDWIFNNWNWPTSWGWDFPMAAMAATRLHQPEKAIKALMMPMQKNTYLPNGHNYQDGRLRIYLPGNGGLLSAIALMCAGWDGCKEKNPGFPKNGQWDVRWEGLEPLP